MTETTSSETDHAGGKRLLSYLGAHMREYGLLIALIAVLGVLGLRTGRVRVGLLAAWLAAASPLLVVYARFARPYALVALCGGLAFGRRISSGGNRRRAARSRWERRARSGRGSTSLRHRLYLYSVFSG